MEPYKEMYYLLFHSTTKAIIVLQEAQKAAENMYISAGEPKLKLIGKKDEKNLPKKDIE